MPSTRERSGRASRTPRSDRADWSLPALRARCTALRRSLGAPSQHGQPTASDLELDAYWPGGAKNPLKTLGGWIVCYANYVRFGGRRERSTTSKDVLRGLVRAAMSDTPEFVALSTGRVGVYPKSLVALGELDALDTAITAATAQRAAACTAADVGPMIDAHTLRSLAVRVWCWIVTHPSAELPYQPEDEDPPVPAWTGQITPQDLLALLGAFRRVNRERNALFLREFPREDGTTGSALSFEGFVGTFVGGKGLDAFDVLHRWSLGRVLAIALSEATTAKEAHARAEAQRKAAG